MVGDACEHVTQICFRIDAVELYGANEAVDFGGTLAAGVCTNKQIVAATDG
jgi:hypothetical protein